jgi:hypothetical protein
MLQYWQTGINWRWLGLARHASLLLPLLYAPPSRTLLLPHCTRLRMPVEGNMGDAQTAHLCNVMYAWCPEPHAEVCFSSPSNAWDHTAGWQPSCSQPLLIQDDRHSRTASSCISQTDTVCAADYQAFVKQEFLAAGWTRQEIDRKLLDLDHADVPDEFCLTSCGAFYLAAAGGDGTRLDPADVVSFEKHLQTQQDGTHTFVYRRQVMEGKEQKVPLVYVRLRNAMLAGLAAGVRPRCGDRLCLWHKPLHGVGFPCFISHARWAAFLARHLLLQLALCSPSW